MNNKGFFIYVIHPRDTQELANHVINSKNNINQAIGLLEDRIILDIGDYKTHLPAGHYNAGIQEVGINPQIEGADLIIIIVDQEAGVDNFEAELRLVQNLDKPYLFYSSENSPAKEKVLKYLNPDKKKDFLGTYIDNSDFKNIIIGAICSNIRKLLQEERKDEKKDVKPEETVGKYFSVPPVNTSIELSLEEIKIVKSVNYVHELNGIKYDFEKSLKDAKSHIKNKYTSDWPYCAAMHLANAIQQPLGPRKFFDSFKIPENPIECQQFDDLQSKIKEKYEEIQSLRHVDKDGRLGKNMKNTQSTFAEYEKLFDEFQNLLHDIFDNYELKK